MEKARESPPIHCVKSLTSGVTMFSLTCLSTKKLSMISGELRTKMPAPVVAMASRINAQRITSPFRMVPFSLMTVEGMFIEEIV